MLSSAQDLGWLTPPSLSADILKRREKRLARWIPRRRRIYDLSGFLRRLDGGCPVKMGASCGPAAPDFPDLPRPAGVGRTQPRCYAARDSADGRRLPRLPSSASGARWTPFFTGQPRPGYTISSATRTHTGVGNAPLGYKVAITFSQPPPPQSQ